MKTITDLQKNIPYFKALSSEVRLKILRIILTFEGISLQELTRDLNLSSNTVLSHLHILENCNLIYSKKDTTGFSKNLIRRYYTVKMEPIHIVLRQPSQQKTTFAASVPISHYTDFDIAPTCGLASPTSFIGYLDEPKYFAHPLKYQAQVLWFGKGYIEYILPNFTPADCSIDRLDISFEISSEYPRTNNNCPSDLIFSIRGTPLGIWTSPGDFGDRRGLLNPPWWYSFLNQYGLLKHLIIDHTGTYMDNEKLSDVIIDDLALTNESILKFRIAIAKGEHENGCTLFGTAFGDHAQEINLKIDYHYDS